MSPKLLCVCTSLAMFGALGHFHVPNIAIVAMLTAPEIMSIAINTVVHLGLVCSSVMVARCVTPACSLNTVSSQAQPGHTPLRVLGDRA